MRILAVPKTFDPDPMLGSPVAGIFLGIVWQRTKNLWLVMAIHAILDLLPNLEGFIKTWNL